VGNFSSPHPFNFTDGSELPAASDEDMLRGKLDTQEVEVGKRGGVVDVDLQFVMTTSCADLLNEWVSLYESGEVDVVLVPLPVKSAGAALGDAPMRCSDGTELTITNDGRLRLPFRVIRVADRKTKAICTHTFCV